MWPANRMGRLKILSGGNVKWDEWRGSLDGRPAMYIKRLLWIPVWRRAGKWNAIRVDLHKFVRPDDWDCFHTHPAHAIRIILWNGYAERYENGDIKHFHVGAIDLVTPRLCHHLSGLFNGGPAYSLWIRGPVCAGIELRGIGWPQAVNPLKPVSGQP